MAPLRDQLTNIEKVKLEIFRARMMASNFPWTVLYWELRCHIIISKAKRRIRREKIKSTKSNAFSKQNFNGEKRIKDRKYDVRSTNFLEVESLEEILKKARYLIEEGEKILADKSRIHSDKNHQRNKGK